MAAPEAHANVAESSHNHSRGRGKGKWKGKTGAMFKGKGKGKPRGRPRPKKGKGDHDGKSKVIAIDAEQRDIGPVHAAPPNTLLTFTNKTKTKVKVNMSLTSPLSLKLNLRSATTYLLAQVVVTSKWMKVKTTFLEVTLIYMETYSNLHKVMLPNVMSTCWFHFHGV
jgi:hypothetical protein